MTHSKPLASYVVQSGPDGERITVSATSAQGAAATHNNTSTAQGPIYYSHTGVFRNSNVATTFEVNGNGFKLRKEPVSEYIQRMSKPHDDGEVQDGADRDDDADAQHPPDGVDGSDAEGQWEWCDDSDDSPEPGETSNKSAEGDREQEPAAEPPKRVRGPQATCSASFNANQPGPVPNPYAHIPAPGYFPGHPAGWQGGAPGFAFPGEYTFNMGHTQHSYSPYSWASTGGQYQLVSMAHYNNVNTGNMVSMSMSNCGNDNSVKYPTKASSRSKKKNAKNY